MYFVPGTLQPKSRGFSIGCTTTSEVAPSYNGSILIVPPKKINQSYYRCDNKFHLDEILEQYEKEEQFGVVLVSGEICRIYTITRSGTHVQIKQSKIAEVHQLKNHSKGGQSAQRFQRTRDENEEAQIKKVVEHMINNFWSHEKAAVTVTSILIGGPAEFKTKMSEHSLIKQYFGSHIVGVITTGTIDDKLINQVYDKNQDLFVSNFQKEGMQFIKQIKQMILKCDDRLIFGISEAKENLQLCLIDKLIYSSELSKDIKEEIKNMNTYDCHIYEVNKALLDHIGVDIVGIKYY
jgi:peptide chain release factor subunit 1